MDSEGVNSTFLYTLFNSASFFNSNFLYTLACLYKMFERVLNKHLSSDLAFSALRQDSSFRRMRKAPSVQGVNCIQFWKKLNSQSHSVRSAFEVCMVTLRHGEKPEEECV